MEQQINRIKFCYRIVIFNISRNINASEQPFTATLHGSIKNTQQLNVTKRKLRR